MGGTAGFLAGAAASAVPGVGPVVGAGVLAATIGGAVAGGGVGGVVGSISGLEMTEAWELTYESLRAGRVVVAVHADDSREAAGAEGIFRQADPLELHRFDARGRRLSAS